LFVPLLSQATVPELSPSRQYPISPAVPEIRLLYADERGWQLDAAATTVVCDEAALAAPPAFEAVTLTRSVDPESPSATR
jgi:hypothetical protein